MDAGTMVQGMSAPAASVPSHASHASPTSRAPSQAPRPTNIPRTVFHAGAAGVAIAAVLLLPSRAWLIAIPGAFAVYAWSMEAARRVSPRVNEALMRLYSRIAHPQERHRVNSATWFGTALVILALTATRPAMLAAAAILGVADPIAGIVGRRWGRRRLQNGRSLEGAAAFFVAGTLAASLALGVVTSATPVAVIGLAAACAFAAAFTELVSSRLDDNLMIPLVAGAVATLGG
jgi:dolichol kinase